MKRIFDVITCVLIFPLALIICACIAVLYICVEREQPLFKQKRIGLQQREFTIYKIRTMRSDTQEIDTHRVSEKSVTKIGGFLRKYKLDELPQLFNVLIGDMSLVGPRPCLVSQHELIKERRALNIFDVRPGITGLSQIEGIDMSDPIKLAESDSLYVKDISFLNDMRILRFTLLGSGRGDSVQNTQDRTRK